MGYRHYFYKLDKNTYEEIKNMTIDELNNKYSKEDPDYFCFLDILKDEIYGFGKLYWDDTVETIMNTGKPFFTKKETMDSVCDFEPYVIPEEGFLKAIEIYIQKIRRMYSVFLKDPSIQKIDNLSKEMTLTEDEKVEGSLNERFISLKETNELTEEEKEKVIEDARDYAFTWYNMPYILNLDKNSLDLTSSWLYEHSIFNLLNQYKHFDFDNNVLVFVGY